jgi:hypothetical protein
MALFSLPPTPHSLDCPVPRLTLLFFSATEDVPEAAKMVTAGTAAYISTGQTWPCFKPRYGP